METTVAAWAGIAIAVIGVGVAVDNPWVRGSLVVFGLLIAASAGLVALRRQRQIQWEEPHALRDHDGKVWALREFQDRSGSVRSTMLSNDPTLAQTYERARLEVMTAHTRRFACAGWWRRLWLRYIDHPRRP